MAICKLCNKEKQLIKQSHIFPDFLYKYLDREENNSMYQFNSKNKPNKIETGVFEKYILCSTCDNELLGKLEGYAYNNFFSKILESNEQITHLSLDYKKIKLFFLSLLWRASLSNKSLFDNVKLNQEQEEFLRKLIYEDTTISDNEFTIVAYKCDLKNKGYEDIIFISPIIENKCTIYLSKININIWLGSQSLPETIDVLKLKESGEMVIISTSSPLIEKERESILKLLIS